MSSINPIGGDYSWLFNSPANNRQNSLANLWSGYNSYQSNATSALAGLTEINTNVKAVLDSYDGAKTAFNVEFDETMSDLSKSAATIKEYSFNVGKEGAITNTTTTDANGVISTQTTYSKDLQSALDVIGDFIGNYNNAVKFFGDNSEVSARVGMLSQTFADTTYRAASYASIGLTTNSDGSITINEAQLADAIVNNPDKVSSVLGSDGLAGKAESHVNFATAQKDNLFPSANSMLGDQLDAAALYTGNAYRNMTALNNVGNLLNMMF